MKVDMKTKNGKISVDIPDDILQAVGENSRDLVNYCGWMVRISAPLTAENWKEVTHCVGEQMLMLVKVINQLVIVLLELFFFN